MFVIVAYGIHNSWTRVIRCHLYVYLDSTWIVSLYDMNTNILAMYVVKLFLTIR